MSAYDALPWPYRVFDAYRRSPGLTGYAFSMPDVMISGEDLSIDWDREAKCWLIVQVDEGGHRWEGRGDSHLEAILSLIADRWGLVATFTPKPEPPAPTPEGTQHEREA